MKKWHTCPLGSVLEISKEKIEPFAHPGKSFDYVGLEHIEGHTGKVFPRSYTNGNDLKSTKHIFHKDEILYGKLRPYLNKVHLADRQGICSTDILVLKPKVASAVPAFVAYFLRSPIVLAQVEGLTQGANLPRLSPSALLGLTMPTPPIPEQKRIVEILDAAEELRHLREEADRRTAKLIPALFDLMFGDPGTNPKGWPKAKLGATAGSVRYGLGQPPKISSDGIPLLRATNVKRGKISPVGLIRVQKGMVPVSRNAFLTGDDVLVVRSGAYTGDVAQVGKEWEGSVAGYDLVVSPGENMTGEFIASFLLSKFIQEDYFGGLKLRAAQPHLNSQQLSDAPLFLPPLPLQKNFSAHVAEIRAMEASQASSRRRLDDLFQSLLHRAFRGEL